MMLRAFKRWAAIAAAAAALLPGAAALRGQDAPPVAVDGTMPEDFIPGLKRLLEAAEKQSPTMVSQATAVAQAQIAVMQSDSSLYPHLGTSVGYGVSREQVSQPGVASTPTSSTSLTYSAGASQTLFAWGAVLDASRIARIQALIAERRYVEAYSGLVAQLRDGYLGLVASKVGLRYADFMLEQARQNLAVAQERLKNGLISSAALGVPELAEGDAEMAADRAHQEYSHAKRILAQLAGVKDIAEEDVPAEVPRPVYSDGKARALLAAILSGAGRTLIGTQTAEMQIKADKLNYRIAATGLLPKFFLTAGDSLSKATSFSQPVDPSTGKAQIDPDTGKPITNVTQTGVNSLSYGLAANWTIFDGFSTRASKRTALETRRADERNLQTYVDQKMEDAQDLARQIEISSHGLRYDDIRTSYARSALQSVTDRAKAGDLSQADVDTSTAGSYLNDSAVAVARRLFFVKWCQLVSMAGADPCMNNLPVHYVRGTP